jgi:deazaflavin-dependent oxidoreductase (nitroreductase family)
MAYLKPGKVSSKIFNSLAMRTKVWGVHTLEVARRSTGEAQRVPVIPVDVDGSRYVASTRGEADWVKNVRAAGRVRLGQKGNLAPYMVAEVGGQERSRVLAAYRKKAGREVNQYFTKLPDEADHPTFRVTPI